jgi:gamma-glutamylputrescine oxidase
MNPLYRNDRPGQFPKSWYAATTAIPPERRSLFGEVAADVCIVGAGFTGLSAAIHLAKRGFNVAVLDAHRAGWGASGRNGGQVGSGYNKSQRWLEKQVGDGPARALWDLAQEAKAQVRDFSAAYAPDARYLPGVAHGAYSVNETMQGWAEAEHLQKNYGYSEIQPLDRAGIQGIVKTRHYQGGVLDTGAGHIHPLRYVIGLAKAAEAAGVAIYERSEVERIDHGDPAVVVTAQGKVRAAHVILAGNGYLPNIESQVASRVMPINSFIAATEPLTDKDREVLTRDIAVADSKFVVNYFRMSEDHRLLFGGRENYGIGFPSDISTALVKRMVDMFPQLSGVRIDYVWGGTLAVTVPRLPCIQRVAPNILSGAGFSGHGVALTGIAGKVMAEAIAGQAERFDVMASLPVPRFPGGAALRAPLLTLAMTWFSLRDRLGI